MDKGSERYTFIDSETIRKVDTNGVPDMHGTEFKLLTESEDGYQVYITSPDPSQPTAVYFIFKRYFYERAGEKAKKAR